jgi:hypothetical protein
VQGLRKLKYGNAVGSAGSLLGIVLFVLDVISSQAVWLIAILYFVGFMVGWCWVGFKTQTAAEIAPPLVWTAESLTAFFSAWLNKAEWVLPPAALHQIRLLQERSLAMLPLLEKSSLSDADRHLAKDAIARYLPDTLNYFLKLPAQERKNKIIKADKTAEALLLEQLQALNTTLEGVAARLYAVEAQDLVINGRFLQNKIDAHS